MDIIYASFTRDVILDNYSTITLGGIYLSLWSEFLWEDVFFWFLLGRMAVEDRMNDWEHSQLLLSKTNQTAGISNQLSSLFERFNPQHFIPLRSFHSSLNEILIQAVTPAAFSFRRGNDWGLTSHMTREKENDCRRFTTQWSEIISSVDQLISPISFIGEIFGSLGLSNSMAVSSSTPTMYMISGQFIGFRCYMLTNTWV